MIEYATVNESRCDESQPLYGRSASGYGGSLYVVIDGSVVFVNDLDIVLAQ